METKASMHMIGPMISMKTFNLQEDKQGVEVIVKTWRKVNDNEIKSYWPVVFFGKAAQTMARRFQEGKQIYVEGIPDIRMFQNEREKFQLIATKFLILSSGYSNQDAAQFDSNGLDSEAYS